MRRGRVRSACNRCRQQKLRCDPDLPCQLCIRAGVPCVPSTIVSVPRRSLRRSNLPQNVETPIRTLLPTGTGQQRDGRTDTSLVPQDDRQARTPSFKIAEKIFEDHQIQSSATAQTDALPGNMTHKDGLGSVLAIKDSLGIDLPSDEVVLRLVDSYCASVQWYLPVLDEPLFRARLAPIIESNSCSARDQSFLMTVVVVLVIGTQFCPSETWQDDSRSGGLDDLQSDLLNAIETNYLRTFDDSNLDWTMFALLLSSLYMLCRQPRRSFVVLGSAIRAAQNMRLDREETWEKVTPQDAEIRRKLWWTLCCADQHATIIGGKAPMTAYDFNVSLPLDRHSLVVRGDGRDGESQSGKKVTIDTYIRLRCTLYQIASPLTNDAFHQKPKPLEETFSGILKLHDKLRDWERNLPSELQLSTYHNHEAEFDNPDARIFRMQALSLQVVYDNMKLMLFRPLVDFNISHKGSREKELNSSKSKDPTGSDAKIKKYSQAQCWESAKRTSLLDEYPETLRMIGRTPAITHIGVQCFTAGVMLGTFALSDPSSDQAQECKRGLARLIKTPAFFGFPENPVWNQSTRILKELLHLIGREEMKSLLTTDTQSPPPGQSVDVRSRNSGDAILQDNQAVSCLPDDAGDNIQPTSQETLVVDALLDSRLALDMPAPSAWLSGDDPMGPNFDSLGSAIASVQQFMHGMGQPNVMGMEGEYHNVDPTPHLQPGPVASNLSWQPWIWDFNTYS